MGLPLWADFFTQAIAQELQNEKLPLKSIAVSSVTHISGEEDEVCRLYAERLTADLVQFTDYIIVDRTNVDKVLSEMELSLEEMSSNEITLKLGQILNAQGLLSLVIAELQEGTEIIASLTEVETARIIFSRSFKDFDEIPSTPQPNQRLEKNLAEIKLQDREIGTEQGGRPAVVTLRPSEDELREKISRAYRKEIAQRLSENNRLRALRENNPRLYRILLAAYNRLGYIGRDKELLTLLVFSVPKITGYLKQKYPGRTRQLYNRYLEIKNRVPRKELAVRLYLRRFQPIIKANKNMQMYMIRMAESLIRS